MTEPTFPGQTWETADPAETGLDPSRLRAARTQLEDHSIDDDPRNIERFGHDDPYRVVVVRNGRIVAEWAEGVDPDEQVLLASATKSLYSNILGIAVEEGMIPSPDAKLASMFPEAIDVLPGEGPKEKRHARHKDREITLRQLIANTSGYLKPDEQPGEVKHYQTFGMNVLTHAIATKYGMYDTDSPEKSPGISLLLDTRLRIPLCGSWDYDVWNFDLPDSAKVAHFGYFTDVRASARDMARLGWLWCQYGRWRGEQLVPESWMREAVQPAPAETEADPDRNLLDTYGYGFWTNATGDCWPSLPQESFAACGSGGMVIWVCPPLDLVVVEGPGPFYREEMNDHLFPAIVDAVRET